MRSKSVLKLSVSVFGRMVLAGFMCAILSLSVTSILSGRGGQVLAMLLNVILYFSLVYSFVWSVGDRDNNLVRYQHEKLDLLKGLKAGVIASVPAFLLSALLVLAKLGAVSELFLALYRILNAPYLPFFLIAMPSSHTMAELSFGGVVLSALTPLLLPVVSMGGYYLGFCRFSVGEAVMYKKS
ncbi:MAG: hypothetical protein LBQ48_06260 [Oscillospiraceae bacterium]|jgi:hypothetical protein|nr:hypothetical protein [Oscillospiraceae bacterium]